MFLFDLLDRWISLIFVKAAIGSGAFFLWLYASGPDGGLWFFWLFVLPFFMVAISTTCAALAFDQREKARRKP